MSEQNSQNTDSAANEQAPVVTTPVVTATPEKPAKRRDIIEIPVSGFKKRVAQEARAQAATEIAKQLGMGIDEAKALIARAQAAPGGDPTSTDKADITQEAVAKLRRELEASKKDADTHKRSAEEEKRLRIKETRRLKDRQIETELRYSFATAGCSDPDYAIHLFQRAALSEEGAEPAAFIVGLKKSKPQLFAAVVEAPPVQVAANTAPPASQNPGENRANPVPAGSAAKPKVKTADDMDPAEFSRHANSTYGFRGGM